jgi:hypothetical protein
LFSTKNFEEKNTTVIISLKSFNKKCTVNLRGKKTTTSSARNIRFNRSATSNVKDQTPQEAWNERTPSFNNLGAEHMNMCLIKKNPCLVIEASNMSLLLVPGKITLNDLFFISKQENYKPNLLQS